MIDVTTTTTVLLDGLHRTDEAAWAEFDRRYRPVLLNFARRLGLADAEAADVAQETMTRFVQEYREGRYQRERGRLRSWLMALARTRIAGTYRRRATRPEMAAGSRIIDLEDEARMTQIWDDEQRTTILREALTKLETTTRIDPKTLRAFELLVVRQLPVASVAAELDLSPQDVYQAKSRVAQRLRTIVQALEAAYEDA